MQENSEIADKLTSEIEFANLPQRGALSKDFVTRRSKLLAELAFYQEMIGSRQEFEDAEYLLKKLTLLGSEIDKQRKELSAPFNEALKLIRKHCSEAARPLDAGKEKLKKLLLDYFYTVLDGDSSKKTLTSIHDQWCFEIENALLVPFEFYSLDEKKVRCFINERKAAAAIPGVRIWSEKVIRSR